MAEDYTVEQGDCLSSIAARFGFAPAALWNLPENAALKQQRKDPNVLYPGDVVHVPDKQLRTECGATQQRHRFRKKNTPAKLRLLLLDRKDQPRANVKYQLLVDGRWSSGTTDASGMIETTMPPHAASGTLVIEGEGSLPLDLGGLDPAETETGVIQRLKNLGYDCGSEQAKWNEDCEAALKQFQQSHGLNGTGQPDKTTRDKLLQVHGS
jgi:hypothetical protein